MFWRCRAWWNSGAVWRIQLSHLSPQPLPWETQWCLELPVYVVSRGLLFWISILLICCVVLFCLYCIALLHGTLWACDLCICLLAPQGSMYTARVSDGLQPRRVSEAHAGPLFNVMFPSDMNDRFATACRDGVVRCVNALCFAWLFCASLPLDAGIFLYCCVTDVHG